jgi:hypothetical protein
MATKSVLVLTDKDGITAFESKIQNYQQPLQRVYDEFVRLNIGTPTYDEVKMCVSGAAAELVKAKILSSIEVPSIGAFKMNVDQVYQGIDKPSIIALEDACEHAADVIEDMRLNSWLLNFFLLDGNTIKVDQVKVDQHKESFKTYATTPEEIEAAEACKALVDALNKVNEIRAKRNLDHIAANHVSTYVQWCPNTTKAQIHPKFFAQLAGK